MLTDIMGKAYDKQISEAAEKSDMILKKLTVNHAFLYGGPAICKNILEKKKIRESQIVHVKESLAAYRCTQ